MDGFPAWAPTLTGSSGGPYCPYCSGGTSWVAHSGMCPRVAAIEYFPNGLIKEVRFHPRSAIEITGAPHDSAVPTEDESDG